MVEEWTKWLIVQVWAKNLKSMVNIFKLELFIKRVNHKSSLIEQTLISLNFLRILKLIVASNSYVEAWFKKFNDYEKIFKLDLFV